MVGKPDVQRTLVPDSLQEAAIEAMVAETSGGTLLGAEMGSGKSLIVTEVILRREAKTVLLICPLGTRIGWERTLRGQGYTGTVVRIDSSVQGKANLVDLSEGIPGVYLVGREYVRRLDLSKIKPDIGVYDECQGFANRQSKSFRVMRTFKPKYRIAMSGTFYNNRFSGAWAVTRWLWPQIVDNSFWRWVKQWCESAYDPWAGVKVLGEKDPGAYVTSLPSYIWLPADLDVDVVPLVWHVELTRPQRRMYDDMQRDMLVWLGDNPLVADLPITMRTRLRQMTLGTVVLNEEGGVDFDLDCKSSKIDALKEILSTWDDEPVLILTDSKRFANVVAPRIGKDAALWTGDTSQKDREALLESFGREGGPTRLVATISALGAGLDGLQHVCSKVVWLSRSEDNTMNQQVLKRLHRRGQKSHVTSIDIQAADTYDEGVLNSLLSQTLAQRQTLTVKEAA